MDTQLRGAWVHLPEDTPKFATKWPYIFSHLEDLTLLFIHFTQKFHGAQVDAQGLHATACKKAPDTKS